MYLLNQDIAFECLLSSPHSFPSCADVAYHEGWAHFVESWVPSETIWLCDDRACPTRKPEAKGINYEHRVAWAFYDLFKSGYTTEVFKVMGHPYKKVLVTNKHAENMKEFYEAWEALYGKVPDEVKRIFQKHFCILNSTSPDSFCPLGSEIIPLATQPIQKPTMDLKVESIQFSVSIKNGQHFITTEVSGVGIYMVQVEIFALNGQMVFSQTAVGSRLQLAPLNRRGKPLPNGVYLYVVTVRGQNSEIWRSEIRRFALLK
jgi:hypothetical protein